ncbi:hypothetical protein NMY22_g2212 [Coprinellus aureogranulatus]|nr:hypothetical protein NMY22_g2212 [Coprinellus aureogranulatus]
MASTNVFFALLLGREWKIAKQRNGPQVGDPRDRARYLVAWLDLFYSDPLLAFEVVLRLCELLPDLRTLVALLAPNGDQQASTLFNALLIRLQHFFWLHYHAEGHRLLPKTSLSCFVGLLNSHSELTTVSVPCTFDGISDLFKVRSWHSRNAFPNLRFLNATFSHSETSSDLVKFLFTSLQNVTVLSFDMNPLRDSPISKPYDPGLLLRLSESGCPINEPHSWPPDVNDIDWFDTAHGQPPQVTTIGLHLSPATSGLLVLRKIW